MSLDSSPGRFRALLRNRDLVQLLTAGLISQTGDWMLATGIGFEIYALTDSTSASAAALFATQAPQVLLGSVAGLLVDRWDRRVVMVTTNVALSFGLLPLLLVRDASHVWIIVVVVAVTSCLTPFFVAADVSLLPALVAEEHLITANALNTQVRNLSRLIGAALGGVIVTVGGLTWLALADVATFALAAVLIGLIGHRSTRRAAGRRRLVDDWVEGLAVLRRSRALLVIVIFFAVSGLGEAVMGTLFAPYVKDVLGGTASTFGMIISTQAIGGIVGGLLVSALGHRVSPRALFGWGAVAFGLGDLALFLHPLVTDQIWPAMVIIALVGLPGAALFAGAMTVFQLGTDDRVRGRVFGALTTVQNLAMLGCTFLAGALAQRLGVLPVITVQGVVYLLAGVLVLLALRPTAAGATTPDPTRSRPRCLTIRWCRRCFQACLWHRTSGPVPSPIRWPCGPSPTPSGSSCRAWWPGKAP
jgi:Na+/melibiose symporter-like transporter